MSFFHRFVFAIGLLLVVISVPTLHISAATSPIQNGTVEAVPDSNAAASASASNSAYLSKQQRDITSTYSTGENAKACIRILSGGSADSPVGTGKLIGWSRIFQPGYWIPVVPNQCVVCAGTETDCPYGIGQNVPLALNLIPQIAIRLYGLIASFTMYGLVLVAAVLGIRYLVAGLNNAGKYKNPAQNLRVVFSALIITLTISTLFLQILYNVLKLDDNALIIQTPCIPLKVGGNGCAVPITTP